MAIGVRFSARGLTPPDVAGRVVFVIDILRATTTMCAALHHGARAVIPTGSTEDALRMAQTLGREQVVLAGERNCLRIEGFELGNSPREMLPEVVEGKHVALTTTNGTRALLAVPSAVAVYIAAAVNLTVSGARARQALEEGQDVLILCAGRDDEFSLDDAYCAGRLAAEALATPAGAQGADDATLATLDLVARYRKSWDRPLLASAAGRELVRLGFAADVAEAAKQDAYPVLAQFHERRVTRASSIP